MDAEHDRLKFRIKSSGQACPKAEVRGELRFQVPFLGPSLRLKLAVPSLTAEGKMQISLPASAVPEVHSSLVILYHQILVMEVKEYSSCRAVKGFFLWRV